MSRHAGRENWERAQNGGHERLARLLQRTPPWYPSASSTASGRATTDRLSNGTRLPAKKEADYVALTYYVWGQIGRTNHRDRRTHDQKSGISTHNPRCIYRHPRAWLQVSLDRQVLYIPGRLAGKRVLCPQHGQSLQRRRSYIHCCGGEEP